MEALEVFAIDKARCRCTGSIPYTSLQWSRRYYECGQFVMQLPSDIYDPEWAYICTGDRPETGRIEKVQYDDTDHTGEGSDTVTISGRFLESYMYDHTFLVEEKRSYEELIQPNPPMTQQKWIEKENEKKPLLKTESGEYLATDAQGNLHGASGEVPPSAADNTTQASYHSVRNAYFYNDPSGDLHIVHTNGVDTNIQSQIVASDGTTTYFQDGDNIFRTSGIITKDQERQYWVDLANWRNKATRTVYVKGYWQITDVEDPYQSMDIYKRLLSWVQMFYQNEMVFAEPTLTGATKVVNPSLKSLGELLYEELKLEQASFRMIYDFELDSVVFEFWKGENRTQSQTQNPWSVFSDEWGTLYNFSASVDTSNYKNTCYVLYDYDQPNSWDGNVPHMTPIYREEKDPGTATEYVLDGYEIKYTRVAGYAKMTVGEADEPERAIYLDLRNTKPDADRDWKRDKYSLVNGGKPTFENQNIKQSYDNFLEGLKERGIQTLKDDYGIIENLDTGTLNMDRYLIEFDLGDVVDASVAVIGMVKEARIIGVDEVYEADDMDVSVIMGDELLTSLRKVKLV